MHKWTRYADSQIDAMGPKVSDERRKSLGVVFRNWHPGPLGFQVVSDTIAYICLHAMELAMEKIDKVRAKHSDESEFKAAVMKKWPRKHALLPFTDLPKPAHCDPKICSVDTPPACTSWEKPVYGGKGIRVSSKDDTMNPYKAEYKSGDKGWDTWVAGDSDLIPRDESSEPKCAHLDHCGVIQGNQDSGFLSLRLPRMTLGRIVVCCNDGSKECGKQFEKRKVEFLFDNKVLPTPTPYLGKCVMVQDKWHEAVKDTTGHVYLGVRVTGPGDTKIRISQVMTL